MYKELFKNIQSGFLSMKKKFFYLKLTKKKLNFMINKIFMGIHHFILQQILEILIV